MQRYYFHVSDIIRDDFNADWSGRVFESADDAVARAHSLGVELSQDSEFKGFVIVSNDDGEKIDAIFF